MLMFCALFTKNRTKPTQQQNSLYQTGTPIEVLICYHCIWGD